MDAKPGKPVASGAVWPVPRTVQIPRRADELTMLNAYLEYYRETFQLKCSGVPADEMSRRSRRR